MRGNGGSVVSSGAEIACAEAVKLGLRNELLCEDGSVHYCPSVSLEVIEARFSTAVNTPFVIPVKVEAECEYSFGRHDCGLGEVGRSQSADLLGVGGQYYAIELHVACVRRVGGFAQEGADEVGVDLSVAVVGAYRAAVREI